MEIVRNIINCEVELWFTCHPSCVMCTLAGASTFTITDTKLYVLIITLSTEDNTKLSKLLSEWFKRPVYWNEYSVIVKKSYNANALIKESIDPSYEGINRLFVLSYEGGNNTVTADSHWRYSYPRVEIKNYNTKIDGRNFYGLPINNQETNDLIKQYNELRKISTRQGDDYTIGFLLNFTYLKKKKKIIIAADLSKQKSFRRWFKSNSTDYFYWQSRWSSSSLLFLWKIKRNNITIP